MNPDIKKAVDILDQRIANLENIKAMLLAEFDGQAGGSAVTLAGRPVQPSKGNGNGNGNQTRVHQLRNFLIAHGPSKRAEIIARAGMPKGTIASLLNRDEFVRRSDGKWQVDVDTKAVQ
jgi:hypothetical protein